ncbi:c6 transcription factor [Stemphylium lycopersici]|uniref:C6 transcription factor n=1 Tax=Stemphylium lycopersici TaxID=183478 RepID=A0A364MZS8_STELY|nr:c6 transcription factor [Stemphylium lycopersici]RAR00765.1 c6 transcription factor [Stemphylium lycopersici]RAR08209.1 c6 transcription factor [Stemphylium lycopersici]
MAMREHISGDCSSDFALASNFPFGSPESKEYASLHIIQELLRASSPVSHSYVASYFRVYHPSMPLIDYSEFETRAQSVREVADAADLSWLAQYFVVLGLGAYATTRDEAASAKYFYASEACLSKTSYMSHPTTTNISTLCLMILAKSVAHATCWALDTSWNAMGFLVRLAMMMVLHKPWMPEFEEPAIVYERELRRRLWVVVVYMDIQMSLITGQQSLLPQDALAITPKADLPTVLEDCFDSILPRSLSIIGKFLTRTNSQTNQITYDEAVRYFLSSRTVHSSWAIRAVYRGAFAVSCLILVFPRLQPRIDDASPEADYSF